MISRNRSRESLRLSKNTSTDYENAYFGSEPVNEELTSVNNIFEDFTEKCTRSGSEWMTLWNLLCQQHLLL